MPFVRVINGFKYECLLFESMSVVYEFRKASYVYKDKELHER